jgi:hypothetical protein
VSQSALPFYPTVSRLTLATSDIVPGSAGARPEFPLRFGGREFALSEAAQMAGRPAAIVDMLRAAETAAEAKNGPRKLFRGISCRVPKFGT